MEEITVRIGTQDVTLKKNPAVVGIRPQVDNAWRLPAEIERLGGREYGRTMAGFALFSTPDPKDSEDFLDEFREHAGVYEGTHVYYISDEEIPFVPTGEIFLLLKPKASSRRCEKLFDTCSANSS